MEKINFKKEEVSLMRVNPLGNIHKENPHLAERFPDAAMLATIAWIYEPFSPINRRFSNVVDRIQQARAQTGYQDILRPEMIDRFCKEVAQPRVWTLIQIKEKNFDEMADRCRDETETSYTTVDKDGKHEKTDIDDKKILDIMAAKHKLHGMMEESIDTIDRLYLKMFAGDGDAVEAARKVEPSFSPENFARKTGIVK